MSDTLEELTYDYEEDGTLVRKQIDRVVLAEGGWATLMFLFQELDPKSGRFRAPKMAIVRFKKSRGGYRKHSSFNISNEKQARQIAAVLERWCPKIAELAPNADDAPDGDEDGPSHAEDDNPAAADF